MMRRSSALPMHVTPRPGDTCSARTPRTWSRRRPPSSNVDPRTSPVARPHTRPPAHGADMTYQNITYDEIEPGIAQLTLNRPQRMNAYDVATTQECVEALGRYASDDSLRVLVLTGAGRGFCSG